MSQSRRLCRAVQSGDAAVVQSVIYDQMADECTATSARIIVNRRGSEGRPPLFYAKNEKVVKLLLDKKADVDMRDDMGRCL